LARKGTNAILRSKCTTAQDCNSAIFHLFPDMIENKIEKFCYYEAAKKFVETFSSALKQAAQTLEKRRKGHCR